MIFNFTASEQRIHFHTEDFSAFEWILDELPYHHISLKPEQSALIPLIQSNDVRNFSKNSAGIARITDDSMAPGGLNKGDMVIIEPTETLLPKEIVVIKIDNFYTMGRLSLGPHANYLIPDNRNYPIIVIFNHKPYPCLGRVQKIEPVMTFPCFY